MKVVLVTLGVGAALLVVVLGSARLDDATKALSCRKYAAATEQTVKYVEWDRCYVQTPAGWRSLEQLRASE